MPRNRRRQDRLTWAKANKGMKPSCSDRVLPVESSLWQRQGTAEPEQGAQYDAGHSQKRGQGERRNSGQALANGAAKRKYASNAHQCTAGNATQHVGGRIETAQYELAARQRCDQGAEHHPRYSTDGKAQPAAG